jgi:hypothetical protein
LPTSQQVRIQLPVAHQVFDLRIAQAVSIASRNHMLGCLRLEEGDHLGMTAKAVLLIDLFNPIEPFLVDRLPLRKRDGLP